MIYYCISRMWLFHAKLTDEVLSSTPEELMNNKGAIFDCYDLKDYGTIIKQGNINAKWKEFPEKVAHSHDVYNAIDLDADAEALGSLKEYLLGENDLDSMLIKFRYRITDFSHLNILTIFELKSHKELESLLENKEKIIRAITRLTKDFTDIFSHLERQGKLRITDDYFGIPNALRKYLRGLEDDTYYYEEFVFVLDNELTKTKDILTVMDLSEDEIPFIYDNMKVYAISQSPIWCVNQKLTILDLTTYIEAQNLIAAEINIFRSTVAVYFAIIKLLISVSDVKNKLYSKKEKVKLKTIKKFGSADLRQMQLRFGIILNDIVYRQDALELWQISYINHYKRLDSIEDKREMAQKGESLLSVLVDKKDQEIAKKHSNVLEAITISFTVLTLCSVYADIVNFVEASHHQEAVFDFFATKNIIVIMFLLLACLTVFYLFKRKDRNRQ